MRIVACAALLLCLSGCAATFSLSPATLAEKNVPVFAPVAVYIDDGTQNNGNAWPHDVEMRQQLEASGLFSAMGAGVGNHTLVVTLSVERNSSSIPFLVSMATLGVLPVPTDFDHTLRAIALVDGLPVKQYRYTNKEKSVKAPITDLLVKDTREAISILVSNLIADLAKDKPFPLLKPVVEGKSKLAGT